MPPTIPLYTAAADCFFDAPLAPPPSARANGCIWDTAGPRGDRPLLRRRLPAQTIARRSRWSTARAAPLLSGYAVVSRDGKFGLLDNTGAELVPCAYDGLAWDGGTAWVKLADGWHEYTIPGVTKPDPLDDLPESIVAPDTRPTRTDIVFFVDTAGERLNVRTGPGLEYDILDKLSDSAQVRLYGALTTAPGRLSNTDEQNLAGSVQDFLVLGH